MFKKLLKKGTIENAHVTPEEVTEQLKETFPEFKIKNKSSKRTMRIVMKKRIVHMAILRMPKGKRIFIKKEIPLMLDIITLGTVEIIEPIIGNKERMRVFTFLKEKYSI